jgi:23S rRNA (pseudouridine1915-N3)-methyltransferase
MRLVVLSVGSPRDSSIAAVIGEYERRAARYFRFESVAVPMATGHGGDPDRARGEEGKALLRRLPSGLETWGLSRSGTALSSRELADRLADMATYGGPGIAFLIGGAFGLGEKVLAHCSRTFSLSRLTLPHDLARLLLAEQLYRAGTILRGEPYHKGA